jgi:hypothetical protein
MTYDGTRVKYVPISDDVRPLQVGCLSVGRVAQRRVAQAFIDQAKSYFSIAQKISASTNKVRR